MNRFAFAAAFFTALGASAVMPAHAQESPTLKKIKDTRAITLGHRESSIPFSYYDDKQQVIGYSQEMMMKAVEGIKDSLKLAKIDTKMTPVTSANRITLVQNGTVDIECGSTTNNLERQKQVGFSTSIFVIGTRLMTKKESGIKDFPDLAGKNVVTTAGTTSERLLRKMNEDKKMGMNIISAKDHGEAFLTLETGRAVAFMMDDALLFGEMAAILEELVKVHAGHLDRLQSLDDERGTSLAFLEEILHGDDRPDATSQQFFVLLDERRADLGSFDAQV